MIQSLKSKSILKERAWLWIQVYSRMLEPESKAKWVRINRLLIMNCLQEHPLQRYHQEQTKETTSPSISNCLSPSKTRKKRKTPLFYLTLLTLLEFNSKARLSRRMSKKTQAVLRMKTLSSTLSLRTLGMKGKWIINSES